MNIAIFLASDLLTGGGFQYEVTIAKLLKKSQNKKFQFVFLVNNENSYDNFKKIGIETILIKENIFQRQFRRIVRNTRIYYFLRKFKLHATLINKTLNELNIDLVYFLSPNSLCLDLTSHNYILTVWDLCHRDQLEFPEVSSQREFETREELFVNALKKSYAILTESQLGKENIVRRYGIDYDRIHSHPLIFSEQVQNSNSTIINIKEKYSIIGDYIFYPAQFWAHKNHIYILRALKILKESYSIIISAVFSGSDKGNRDYILSKAKEYNIDAQIFCIGFADAEEIPSLYKQSLALVMPTYFGPTNIPPLEAFHLECPVCYSDLPGLRDQVGEAGFLMDLDNPESLTKHLIEIKNNVSLVNKKISIGKLIVNEWTEEDLWNSLLKIFNQFKTKRDCWPD